jgi:hypothetical protein
VGMHVLQPLWDIEKFFDSIRIEDVVELSLAMSYPAVQLALGAQAHTAPRFLRASDSFSLLIDDIDTSILAGCMQSTSWARAVVYDIVEEMHLRWPSAGPSVHVDDMGQVIAGEVAEDVVDVACDSAIFLVKQLATRGLTMSTKSVLLPADSPLAVRVRSRLQCHGIILNLSLQARDVGLDATAGKRRSETVAKGRAAKAKERARAVGRFSATNKKSKKLFHTGSFRQEQYGAAAMGKTPSQIAATKRNATAAIGANRRGRDATITLALEFADGMDPEVMIPLDQLKQWTLSWDKLDDGLRKQVRRAWMIKMPQLRNEETRWKRVKGFMSATIATIMDLGWAPIGPTVWLHGSGQSYTDIGDPSFSFPQFQAFLMQDIRSRMWARSAVGHLGQGLELGADLTVTKKVIAKLRAKGEAHLAGAIVCTAAGGQWTQERLACTAKPMASTSMCPRCGTQPETEKHRYYQCAANSSIEDRRVSSTNFLVERALRDFGSCPCFWGRGLVPLEWIAPPHEPVEATISWSSPGPRPTVATLCTDGSGGPCNSDARLRRVGAAAVEVCEVTPGSFRVLELLASTVPGRQTVPRAETFSEVLAIRIANGRPATSHSDASYVVNNFHKPAVRGGLNGDVWGMVHAELLNVSAGEDFNVQKVKAHCDRDSYVSTASPLAIFGNAVADHFADEAARVAAFSGSEQARIAKLDKLASQVILRMAVIDVEAAKVGHVGVLKESKVAKRSFKDSLQASFDGTGHLLVDDGRTRVQCRKCKEKFHGRQLLKRMKVEPCRGWRLVRDGRLCYAASIVEVAPRFASGVAIGRRTTEAAPQVRARPHAHGLDDPEGDSWHSGGEAADVEPPQEEAEPGEGSEGSPTSEPIGESVIVQETALGRVGLTASMVVQGLQLATPLCVYGSVFERDSVDRANVTGIASRVDRSHVVGEALDAVFCWRCGAHSFGTRFVLLRKPCQAPAAAGAAFLAGLRHKGSDYLRSTIVRRRIASNRSEATP